MSPWWKPANSSKWGCSDRTAHFPPAATLKRSFRVVFLANSNPLAAIQSGQKPGDTVSMAEPLKKSELSHEVEAPQPFPNQQLRDDDRSLDSVPKSTDVRVDTLGSNVVAVEASGVRATWRRDCRRDLRRPESSVAEEYLEFRDAVSDMVDQGRRSVARDGDSRPTSLRLLGGRASARTSRGR